jgi:hypothetical protein
MNEIKTFARFEVMQFAVVSMLDAILGVRLLLTTNT